MNFEGVYFHDGLADLTEIWNGMCPTLRDFPQQKWCSSVQALSSYRCVKTAFSWFLYNTHLSVARSYWLYLPARHTIMCLDTRNTSNTYQQRQSHIFPLVYLKLIHYH